MEQRNEENDRKYNPIRRIVKAMSRKRKKRPLKIKIKEIEELYNNRQMKKNKVTAK